MLDFLLLIVIMPVGPALCGYSLGPTCAQSALSDPWEASWKPVFVADIHLAWSGGEREVFRNLNK